MMKLLFERSRTGRKSDLLPACDVPTVAFDDEMLRSGQPRLPELSEVDVARHYTELSKQTYGVNDGFYPLGSCTMKYNPAVCEDVAALPGFTDIHPLQPDDTVQGCLEVMHRTEKALCEICGMDALTLQPAAGAHGEYTGLLLIRAYHQSRGDTARTKIIVPDSAHGTNPASAVMAGFEMVAVSSNAEGGVDLDELRRAVGPDTAGLMLTNPNTLGLFDRNILEICRIVHEAGGLCYYDGANLNAVMGWARPGDMGFDCMHVNLHKTFATPHGGGGPGSGPVGCKEFLADFLPGPRVEAGDEGLELVKPARSIGRVRGFAGNFLVVVRALTYLLLLGSDGMREASGCAVLNATYLMRRLQDTFPIPYHDHCMHEFVIDMGPIAERTGANAMDFAKRMLDFGIHPPTMYFPLIVHEALMAEPTETEGPETLDAFVDMMSRILHEAEEDGERLHGAPFDCPIGRPDEVAAARKPVVRYAFD